MNLAFQHSTCPSSRARARGAAGRGLLIGAGVVLLLVVLVGGCGVSQYNSLKTSQQNVAGRWAEIDNQYKRRFDLIPNLVETVKGAANFEKSTLEAVVEARASVGRAQLPQEMPTDPKALEAYVKAQQGLSGALGRLFAVSENYPDLKSSKNFLSLQDQLEGTENRIAVARRDYIDAVQQHNTRVARFPANLIASTFGIKEAAQFQAPPEEKAIPKVQFDFDPKKK
jgi:LemA protein